MNAKTLAHADVLIHMVKHGFSSVEYYNGVTKWVEGTQNVNPFTFPLCSWRIKQEIATLHIEDFPMPEKVAPKLLTSYYPLITVGELRWLWEGDDIDLKNLALGQVYLDESARDKAREMLVAALLPKKQHEVS